MDAEPTSAAGAPDAYPAFIQRPGLPDAFQEEAGSPAWQRSLEMACHNRRQTSITRSSPGSTPASGRRPRIVARLSTGASSWPASPGGWSTESYLRGHAAEAAAGAAVSVRVVGGVAEGLAGEPEGAGRCSRPWRANRSLAEELAQLAQTPVDPSLGGGGRFAGHGRELAQ